MSWTSIIRKGHSASGGRVRVGVSGRGRVDGTAEEEVHGILRTARTAAKVPLLGRDDGLCSPSRASTQEGSSWSLSPYW